jgi:seryl-tRNA synthetase
MTEQQVEERLKAMHEGLLGMQARLDDHQKVIEQLMLVMQNLTSGQVPNGFRQPKKGH